MTVSVSAKRVEVFFENFDILQRNDKLKEILKTPHYHSTISLYSVLNHHLRGYLDIAETVQIDFQNLKGFYKVCNADPSFLYKF